MDVTIFYAWQTERPENLELIRTTAQAACEPITRDTSYGWRVTLDSDTQGVAGMCDIPIVILKKIRECDIFLGDLTYREPLKFLTRKFGWPYNFCFTQAGDWNLR